MEDPVLEAHRLGISVRDYVVQRNRAITERRRARALAVPANPAGAYCQDERCEIICAHPPHVFLVQETEEPSEDLASLDIVILRHLRSRTITPFSALYNAVLNDYGSVGERTVQRAVRALVGAGSVQKIPLPTNPRLGAYVLGSTDPRHREDLLAQVEDHFTI